MIVAVTGWPNAGKDAIGDILVGQGFARLAMGADILLPASRALNPITDAIGLPYSSTVEFERFNEIVDQLGYEEAKRVEPEVRAFMQRLGYEFLDAIGKPALWIECLMDKYVGADAVMTSCRRLVECETVRRRGGEIWRVNRPGIDPGDHPVEHEVDDYPFDVVIQNDGTLADLAFAVTSELVQARLRRRAARTESVVWTDHELKRVDL